MLKIARGDLAAPVGDSDAIADLLTRRDWVLRQGLDGLTLRSLLEEGDWPADAHEQGAQAQYS
jgi:hypothetical protein